MAGNLIRPFVEDSRSAINKSMKIDIIAVHNRRFISLNAWSVDSLNNSHNDNRRALCCYDDTSDGVQRVFMGILIFQLR